MSATASHPKTTDPQLLSCGQGLRFHTRVCIVESAAEEFRALIANHDRALDEDLKELRTLAGLES